MKVRKSMRILLLSSSSPYKTAGVGILYLKNYLENKGHTVKLITKRFEDNHEKNVISYHSSWYTKIQTLSHKILNKTLRAILRNVEWKYSIQTFLQFIPLISTKKILKLTKFNPDVIVVFFMQQFVNYIDLANIHRKTKAPIFVMTPDMSCFTGLCHFSYRCSLYEKGCGYCPAISSNRKNDLSKINLNSKIRNSSNIDMIGLYWSDFTGNKLKKSLLFKNKPIEKIPTLMVVDNVFSKPTKEDFKELRRFYGIDEESFVICFCAVSLNSVRKGIKDIISAINILSINNKFFQKIVIVTAGKGPLPQKPNVKKVVNFGFVEKNELSKLFKMSNLCISASHDDVGPATIGLSLACGVPVISYKTGIAPSLIKENFNGYLVKTGDVESLSKKIESFTELPEYKWETLSNNCLKTAIEFYRSDKFEKIETVLEKYLNFRQLS